jgi:hypothetical protein
MKSFEVKFKLSDLKGNNLGTFSLCRKATKSVSDEQLAGRNIAWLAKSLGLKADIVTSVGSKNEADKFAPVRVKIETAKERSARLAKERRQAKKAAVVTA